MKKIMIKSILGLLSTFILFLSFFAFNYRNNIFGEKYGICHISIDDTIDIFKDLTINEENYSSIFDNYTLNYCNKLHNQYGLKVSFYCFYEKDDFNLSMTSNKYRNEFIENSDWLKFAFHAYNDSENLNTINIDKFIDEYLIFKKELIRTVGNKSIDTFTRLSSFKGNKEICEFLVEDGYDGFYSADDERMSYYLTNEQCGDVFKSGIIKDDLNIYFIKTDLCLDNSNNPFNDLLKMQNDDYLEIFTYEWLLRDGKGDSVWKLREACNFAKKYKVGFDYLNCDKIFSE